MGRRTQTLNKEVYGLVEEKLQPFDVDQEFEQLCPSDDCALRSDDEAEVRYVFDDGNNSGAEESDECREVHRIEAMQDDG